MNTFEQIVENKVRDTAASLGVSDPVKIQQTVDEMLIRVAATKFRKNPVSIKSKNAGSTDKFSVEYPRFYNKMIEKEVDVKIASNGAVFRAEPSPFTKYLGIKAAQRTIEKKAMKKAKNAGDDKGAKSFDNAQKATKEISNSAYGLINLTSFTFFDSFSANAITAIGVEQGQSIIRAFEISVGNRIHFKDYAEVFNFLTMNSLTENDITTIEAQRLLALTTCELLTAEHYYEKIIGHCEFELSPVNSEIIRLTINKIFSAPRNVIRFSLLGHLQRTTVNYRPLKKFLVESDYAAILHDEDYATLCDLSTTADSTDSAFQVENFERSAIVLSDTDSAYDEFTELGSWIDANTTEVDLTELKEKFPVASEEGLRGMFKFNIFTALGEVITAKTLKLKSDVLWNSGVEKYNWKSENTAVLINTSGKKLYAYKSVVNEGVPAAANDISAKGFDKSIYSAYSRANQFDMIDILLESKTDKQMYETIFSHIRTTAAEVAVLINELDLSVYAPVKARDGAYYDEPWGQWQSAIARINEELFTEHAANGEKQAYVKLLIPKLSSKLTVEERVATSIEFIRELSPRLADKVKTAVVRNNDMYNYIAKDGLKSIGIPITAGKLPEELLPLIDVEEIIGNNTVGRVKLWLEVIGVEVTNEHRTGVLEYVDL